MSELFLSVCSLVGGTVFGFIGLGVCYLVSERYWNSGKYGLYDLPWWIEFGIIPFFVILWAVIMVILMLTVWKPDVQTGYTITLSL